MTKKKYGGNDYNPNRIKYNKVFQYCVRCRSKFTRPEKEMLEFINERTLRFGKEYEKIPIRVFMEGVMTKESGNVITDGLSYSKNTINQACHTLKDKGYIEMELIENWYLKVYRYKIDLTIIDSYFNECEKLINELRNANNNIDETKGI